MTATVDTAVHCRLFTLHQNGHWCLLSYVLMYFRAATMHPLLRDSSTGACLKPHNSSAFLTIRSSVKIAQLSMRLPEIKNIKSRYDSHSVKNSLHNSLLPSSQQCLVSLYKSSAYQQCESGRIKCHDCTLSLTCLRAIAGKNNQRVSYFPVHFTKCYMPVCYVTHC